MGMYAIFLVSTVVAKKPLVGIAIAKGRVNRHLVMHKWQIFANDFAKEWVEYLFLAMTANAQCEPTLTCKN